MFKQSPFAIWCAALTVPVALFSGVAHAATYTVINLRDSGAGSLRQAIADANATLGVADTIAFDPGVTGTITLTTGEMQITDKLTINGPGAAVLTISGNQSSRIFLVKTMNTTIAGLTLKDGSADSGGAIRNQGNLTLNQLNFTNNKAEGGWWGNNGGAVYNEAVLNMTEVNFADNSTGGSGGAFFNSRTATINNSTFSGNDAGVGGAIYNDTGAQLTVTNTTLTNNHGRDGGGAITNFGQLALHGDTFTTNKSSYNGGGVGNGGALTVTNSLFVKNYAEGVGGAIDAGDSESVMTVQNSTFSENNAGRDGGAIWLYSDVTILNSTFTGNYAAGQGGSVSRYLGTLKIGNTISIGNFAPTASEVSGELTSLGNNLFGSNGNAGVTDLTYLDPATDITLAGDPSTVLGPLMDNGGLTQTHALMPGSPAIDAGENTIVPAELTTDQRGEGFARITGAAVDIGAFEEGAGGVVKNQLNVSIEPVGSGTVTSNLEGINCGGDCAENYDASKSIELTATPAAGATFIKWSGACTGNQPTCTVSMDQPRSVTAEFSTAAPQTYALSVSVNGNGGKVSGTGIACPGDCGESYASGTPVMLGAETTGTTTFTNWSGDCSGNLTTCTVTMDAIKNVTANFQAAAPTYSLTVNNFGSGTVSSTGVAGINCGPDCSDNYTNNQTVVLTATPMAGKAFLKWYGACAGVRTNTCTVTMNANQTATAFFTR
ncbi:hypothetical protein HUU61_00240 [Rhodopseudomonas palustris]|nr:hypothetical protein [Rhodopseudomonas palustris]